MSKIALTIENYTPEQLKALLRKDEKFQQGVRLFACYQVSLGKRPKDLEEMYDTTFKSICNWVHRFNEGGVEALKDHERSGRPNRLSDESLKEIKKVLLEKSPEQFGYNTGTWNGPLVIDYIKKKYTVDYKKAQIYNILKKMGLTYQKGRGIYPETKDREPILEELKKNFR
jgi:transposase